MTGKRNIGLTHKLVAGGFIALPLLIYLVVSLMLPSQASSLYCSGGLRRSADMGGELAECSGPPVWLALVSQAGIFGGIAAAALICALFAGGRTRPTRLRSRAGRSLVAANIARPAANGPLAGA